MAVNVAACPTPPRCTPRTSAAASYGLFFVRPRKVKSDLPTTIREVSMNGESFAFKGKKWENGGCWGPFYKPSRICNYCYCLAILMEIFFTQWCWYSGRMVITVCCYHFYFSSEPAFLSAVSRNTQKKLKE